MTDFTPILNLPQVAPNQDQKEATINTALAILEAAMNDTLAISVAAGDVVLNTDQFTKYFLHQITGASVARTLSVPNTNRWFAVENQGTAMVTVKVTGATGATVDIGAGKIGLLVTDSANVRVVVPDPSAGLGKLVDLSDVSGTPTDGQLLRWNATDVNWEPWTLNLAFTQLSDSPGSYIANAGKLLAVKADGSGLEYVSSAANIHKFTDLSDAPGSYTNAANLTVKVNSAGTGLIFAQPKITDAIDFPLSYSGAGLKYVRVNAGATALEFHAPMVADLSDGPGAPATGAALMYVRVKSDGSGLEYANGTGGPDHFYQLADVPQSYGGSKGLLLRVNSTENGLIYSALKFTELSGVPTSYIGQGGKYVQVKPNTEDQLIFVQPKVGDLSDGPGAFTGNAKKVVRVNAGAAALEYAALALTDLALFPNSLTGQGGKFLQVKIDETGLQFSTSSVSMGFLALNDTPKSYTGHANASVTVDPTGTGLVFGPIVPTRLGQLTDVEDGTGTPQQGAFLRWIDGVWQADVFTPAGGGSAVSVSNQGTALTSQVKSFNFTGPGVQATSDASGGVTVTVPMIPDRLGQLADVEDGTGTPQQGAFLRWIDGVWQADVFTPAAALSALTDVDEATAPVDGQVLTFSADEGKWKPAAPTGSSGGGSGATAYFGSGAPTTLQSEGSLYFDIDQTPYASYVQHLSGWEPFGPPGMSFDVALYVEASPTASERLMRVPITRASSFAANFAGSFANASTATTGATVFDVRKNGTSVGSVTFAAAATTATFASSGGTAVSFAAGDYLEIIAPNTPDATLKEIGISLRGARN